MLLRVVGSERRMIEVIRRGAENILLFEDGSKSIWINNIRIDFNPIDPFQVSVVSLAMNTTPDDKSIVSILKERKNSEISFRTLYNVVKKHKKWNFEEFLVLSYYPVFYENSVEVTEYTPVRITTYNEILRSSFRLHTDILKIGVSKYNDEPLYYSFYMDESSRIAPILRKFQNRVPKYILETIDEDRVIQAGWIKQDGKFVYSKKIIPTNVMRNGKIYKLVKDHPFYVHHIVMNPVTKRLFAEDARHPNVSDGEICVGGANPFTTDGAIALPSQLRTINLDSCYWTPNHIEDYLEEEIGDV